MQVDSLDIEDRHYDRKLSDLQDRLEDMRIIEKTKIKVVTESISID